MTNNYLVSIVIINYNGHTYTQKCIQSILDSNTQDFEIIVVDNNSTDNSVQELNMAYSSHAKVKCIQLDKNYGPAKARNVGVANSKGDFIAFLDNDTIVDKEWATSASQFLLDHPEVGALQCKLLLNNNKNEIDYVGEYLGQNGFLVQRAVTGEVDNGQYDQVVPILAAKSAGMFVTRKAFDDISGFDEDYFIYVEETDLGWRMWLRGYKVLFFPHSKVWHEFGTSSVILSKSQNNFNTKFHGCKNYILTLTKNLGIKNLILILPVHIFLWLGLAWYSLIKKQFSSFVFIHKAFLWNLFKIVKTLTKRRHVQSKRKISDNMLFKDLMKHQNLAYFLDKATKIRKVGNAEGFIKTT